MNRSKWGKVALSILYVLIMVSIVSSSYTYLNGTTDTSLRGAIVFTTAIALALLSTVTYVVWRDDLWELVLYRVTFNERTIRSGKLILNELTPETLKRFLKTGEAWRD